MTHEVKGVLIDVGEAVVIGGSYSYGMAEIMPEIIHGAMVLSTGLITAIAVFILNRWMRKKYPDNK